VRSFREAGVLPEALANFLALLGWSTADGREILSLDEMTAAFALVRVGRTPAVFSEERLHWLNRHYLRNTSAARLWEPAAAFLSETGFLPGGTLADQRERLTAVLDLMKGGLKSLRDIVAFGPLFFRDDPGWGPDSRERLNTPEAQRVLALFRAQLDGGAPHTPESFHAAMREIQRRLDLGGNVVYPIVRLAVSGIMHGPELDRLLGVLGPDLVRRRLELVGVLP
jgi:nondiscriminating glutamyl-tRNA synthetase